MKENNATFANGCINKLSYMKRFILISLLLLIGVVAKAQYNNFNPYLYAAISAEADDTYRLNNIRFDENAIRQNPEAWHTYNNYLSLNAEYLKKNKIYNALGWSGLGIMCLSCIPLLMPLSYDYNDPRSDTLLYTGLGLLSAGTIVSTIGLCGIAIQMDKIKINKKEFIYYLKTTNNGVGIVSIF